MFTGLIEDLGQLRAISGRGRGVRLRIATRLSPLVLGESVSVMGVCLTVDKIIDGGFEADASQETLIRSTLRTFKPGQVLHLERAVGLGDRLGGHIVSGHVDGVIHLSTREMAGDATRLTFEFDSRLAPFVASKGSVAIDGVSLTVNEVAAERFDVMVIPHTLHATHLGKLRVGDACNLEVDVLARYVVRWLETRQGLSDNPQASGSFMDRLASAGYL